MGDVDSLDRGISQYRPAIKSKKWWFPHFTNTVSSLLWASWKLYKVANPTTDRDFLSYLRSIITAYLPGNCRLRGGYVRASKKKGGWRVDEGVRSSGNDHWLIVLPGYGNRCAVPTCTTKIRFQCKACKLCYCPRSCWEIAHTP